MFKRVNVLESSFRPTSSIEHSVDTAHAARNIPTQTTELINYKINTKYHKTKVKPTKQFFMNQKYKNNMNVFKTFRKKNKIDVATSQRHAKGFIASVCLGAIFNVTLAKQQTLKCV